VATTADAEPGEPYPEFPRIAHQNVQSAKKIKGKQWFFGVWSDPDAALRKYLDEVDEIQAGSDPRRSGVVRISSTQFTVADLCSLFLERQERRVDIGEVSRRHFTDNQRLCRKLVEHIGRFTGAAALRTADFPAFIDFERDIPLFRNTR
jgi:hypothetical protein